MVKLGNDLKNSPNHARLKEVAHINDVLTRLDDTLKYRGHNARFNIIEKPVILKHKAKLENKQARLQGDIMAAMEKAELTDLESQIIKLRFFRSYQIKAIAQELNYSPRQINRILTRALVQLEK